jgi:acyl carrier protein
MPRAFAILSIVLVLTIGVLGCSHSSTASPELLEKVRQQVAKTLRKDAAQLDVRKLLALQGARDIDIVVILIEVEDTFKVELPDSINQKTPQEFKGVSPA